MSALYASKRLELFPITTQIEADRSQPQRLIIGGFSLADLADEFGTPLYLYDQATMDWALDAYEQALADSYPGETRLTYAGKAFLCMAMVQWVQRRGLCLDCSSAGELQIAAAAGLPREQTVVHGVNKSPVDLATAIAQAGIVVADNLVELDRIAALANDAEKPALPEIWLRVRPGLAVATHAHRQTGQRDSKFGMSRGEIEQAIQVVREFELPLTGLHFHLGSQFRDPAPVSEALDRTLDLAADLASTTGWVPRELNVGGGWGVAYHEDELPQPAIGDFVRNVSEHLAAGCDRRALPLPRLGLEPGRSIVAQAGVAVYRVGAVKRTAQRHWLLLDGGLADNPRPALYGARYSALPALRPGRPVAHKIWLGGPYCESGDVLIEALPLPDITEGELVAVPVSGAYQLSMASNYNGACRPAVVWLAGENAYLVQDREKLTDLHRRDRLVGTG